MALQSGASAKLYMKKESTYGTAATGNYANVPFFSVNLGAEQPLITPTVIGASSNRDPGAPIKDVITVSGDVEVPVDANNLGFWLNMALGAPTTTGTTDFTHVFKSGGATLPSYTVEHAMASVPNFAQIVGAMAGGFSMNFSPSGEARSTFQMVGQGQTNATTSAAGTVTTATYAPFGQFQGTIKRNGSALGFAAEAQLSFSNNLETVRTIRSDGKVDGFIPGITNASGSLGVYFTDTTLLTQATNGTSCSIELAYTISATQSLVLLLHEVYLPVPKLVTSGPTGVRATFAYQAAFNSAQSAMLTATLKNQTSAY
jgi:hypothetical protein